MKWGVKCILSICFLGISLALSVKADTIIKLKEEVTVNKEYIYLKDIVYSLPQLKNIGDILIGKAPLPGRKRIISKEYILLLLKKEGFDGIKIIPDRIIITSSYQTLGQELVLSFIKKVFNADNSKNVFVSLYSLSKDRLSRLYLPKGEIKLALKKFYNTTLRDCGLVFLPLQIYVNNRLYTQVNMGVLIEKIANIVVAKKDIPRNKPITKEDIQIKEYRIKDKKDYIYKTQLNEVLGKCLKLAKCKGDIILKDDLIQPYVIKTSEIVQLILEDQKNGILVEAKGRAYNNARLNERIKVKNLTTDKIVEGIAIAKSKVKILIN
jgi:flagella basal body P-ring formation protein FlgA